MKEFRLLKADEIEVRVGHVSGANVNKAMLLLYKDARCDMKILDETLGITGWQRTHEVIDGQLFCNVSIYDEDKKQWIVKQDVGVESFSEAEKGRASDAFKRACFNLGIGRELYTAPMIWVASKTPIKDKKDWNYKKFRVKEIGYNEDRAINMLVIEEYVKSGGWQEIFRYGNKNTYNNKPTPPPQKPKGNKQTEENGIISKAEENRRGKIENMFSIAKQVGVEFVDLQTKMASTYKKTSSSDLTDEEIDELTEWLTQQSFI